MRRMRALRLPGRSGERGQTLLLTVLFLPVLMGCVSLAVDIGEMNATRRELQNAVDAAAHAGVQVLPYEPGYATAAAQSWAQSNGVSASELTQNSVLTTTSANDTITVSATRSVNYTFGRVLNLFTANVSATATAMVGSIAGGSGIMPFGIVDLNGASAGFGYAFGQSVTLEQYPSNFAGGTSPGNYGLLALDGSGANSVGDAIRNNGSRTVFNVGDRIPTKPGQNVGQVGGALNSWAAGYGDGMGTTCDNFAASHTYNGGKLVVVPACEYRVILLPIIDEWPRGGRNDDVTIKGFAQMYLASYNSSSGRVTAYFLKDTFSHPDIILGAVNSYGTTVFRITQ